MSNVRGRIAVFDSGMGGLDVAAALSRVLPKEQLVYLGDNARVPYGTKSAEMVRSYTYEAANRLLEHNIKALVIACNTASAAVDISALAQKINIPVFGMIEAGVLACQTLINTRPNLPYEIITLATPGTIRSQAYQSALKSSFPQATQKAIACPIFVPLVEMGWESHSLTTEIIKAQLAELFTHDSTESNDLKSHHKPKVSHEKIYLLGCTHYPMMKEAIQAALDELHNSQTHLPFIPFHCLDGAESVAYLVQQRLSALSLLKTETEHGPHQVYLTDKPNGQHYNELALRFWHKRGGLGELNIQYAP